MIMAELGLGYNIAIAGVLLLAVGAAAFAAYWFLLRKQNSTNTEDCAFDVTNDLCDPSTSCCRTFTFEKAPRKKCTKPHLTGDGTTSSPLIEVEFDYPKKTVTEHRIVQGEIIDTRTHENAFTENSFGKVVYRQPCFDSVHANEGLWAPVLGSHGVTIGCHCLYNDENNEEMPVVTCDGSQQADTCATAGTRGRVTFELYFDDDTAATDITSLASPPELSYLDATGEAFDLNFDQEYLVELFAAIQAGGKENLVKDVDTGNLSIADQTSQNDIVLTLEKAVSSNIQSVRSVLAGDAADAGLLPPTEDGSRNTDVWKWRFGLANEPAEAPKSGGDYLETFYSTNRVFDGSGDSGVDAGMTDVIDWIDRVEYLPLSQHVDAKNGAIKRVENLIAPRTARLSTAAEDADGVYAYEYAYNETVSTRLAFRFNPDRLNTSGTIQVRLRRLVQNNGQYGFKGFRFWRYNILHNFGENDLSVPELRFFDWHGVQLLPLGYVEGDAIYKSMTNADVYDKNETSAIGIKSWGPFRDNQCRNRDAFESNQPLQEYSAGRHGIDTHVSAVMREDGACSMYCPFFSQRKDEHENNTVIGLGRNTCTDNSDRTEWTKATNERYKPRLRGEGCTDPINAHHIGIYGKRVVIEFEFAEPVAPKYYQVMLRNNDNAEETAGQVRNWWISADSVPYDAGMTSWPDDVKIRSSIFWYSYNDRGEDQTVNQSSTHYRNQAYEGNPPSRGTELFEHFVRTTDVEPDDQSYQIVDRRDDRAKKFWEIDYNANVPGYFVTRGHSYGEHDHYGGYDHEGRFSCQNTVTNGTRDRNGNVLDMTYGNRCLFSRRNFFINNGIRDGFGMGFDGAKEIWELEVVVDQKQQNTPNMDVGRPAHNRLEKVNCVNNTAWDYGPG